MKSELPPLFKPGVIRMRSAHTVSTLSTKEEVAKMTTEMNDPLHLRESFFPEEAESDVLFTYHVREDDNIVQTQISVTDPTGLYYPDAVMVIAATYKMLRGNPIGSFGVYDLPSSAQDTYWDIVREIMRFNKGSRYVENAASHYSNESVRTAKSIGLPHGQIGTFDPNLVEPFPSGVTIDDPSFKKQNEFLMSHPLIKYGIASLRHNLKKEFPKEGPYHSWKLLLRSDEDSLPLGYSVFLSGEINNLFFTRFLYRLHKAYESAASEILHRAHPEDIKDSKPQPSYNFFLEEWQIEGRKGYLMTIAPVIYSHAGVHEVNRVLLDRKPDHPENFSTDVRKKYLAALSEHLQETF